MTGLEAAEIVRRMCREAGHAVSPSPGAEPLVCGHCRKVANELVALHRDANPVPPAVLVHLVVDETGLVAAMFDEPKAIEKARSINAVVASLPVSSDWRNVSNEEDGS